VRWSDPISGAACTTAPGQVKCSARLIGGDHDFTTSYVIFTLRAARAGKYPITARVEVAGDPNSANDTVKKTVTVRKKKPKPR
jgi:hypothetical protein